MKTFAIETWGCQMNHHDSERLTGFMKLTGLDAVEDSSGADVILLNTCSVRERPVHKILSRIGDLARTNPSAVIGVCGCVAQQEGESLLRRGSNVGFVLGPGQVQRVGEAIRALQQGRRTVFTGFDPEQEYCFHTIFRKSSTRGMVTVAEGCGEYCTFCVVPHTRGREVSRPFDEILAEVRLLVRTGMREVELLGQTINAYRCPASGADFAQLLDAIAREPGLARVRFITSHPRYFTDRLIEVMATHSHVSRYLHLPFQAGSNRILERMHRRYTREQYVDLINRIREAVPGVNISTDVIVGFPGEDESDFERTLNLLESLRFGQVFAFAFSARPGTPATRYRDQVSEEVKSQRLQRLFAVADRVSLELNEKLIGQHLQVIVDGDSRRSSSDWQGRSDGNRVVNFPKQGLTARVGDVIQVRITRASAHSLYGEAAVASSRLPVLGASVAPLAAPDSM
ncbi:MAG: tRNA (N6-isopentenyl adenosine(37)-C2)-methylthiotransferase MiaB [Acidobacteria bacterium]|jgi:tRNA-2-methylthio-N6-dimethylallyladenosine synthase|nr:tRNA (N6-isopentenyl adenosine(37)-C2)-methylthiotransferase MiaB [Acidobacteriota bacterium]